jgi:hypothetical protein
MSPAPKKTGTAYVFVAGKSDGRSREKCMLSRFLDWSGE